MPSRQQTQSQLTLTSGIDSNHEKFRKPPWWNRRTRLERFLFSLVIIFTFIIVGCLLSILFVSIKYKVLIDETSSSLIDGKKVCLTSGCVRAASEIINSLNESINPCDDFYEFSCGGWLSKQFISEDRSSVSNFLKLQEILNNKLRILIENPDLANSVSYMKKISNYYQSCTNLTNIELDGTKNLETILNDLGGWPVLVQDWDASQFDWSDLIIKLRKIGYNHDIIFDVSVTTDFKNNSRNIIDLDQASFGTLDRNNLLKGFNDKTVQGYFKLIVESAVLLGGKRDIAKEQLKKVIEFEITLANFSLPLEERRNFTKLYNKKSIQELSLLAPNINWMKLLNGVFQQNFDQTEEVIVNVPDYVLKVNELLASADKKVVANYIIWRAVLQSMPTLSKNWRALIQEYNKLLTGQDREEPRWELCLNSLSSSLGIGLSSFYVKNYFNRESKKTAMTMVNYIKNEFINILKEIDWMDEKTTEVAIAKAQAISTNIGYPEELLNETLVNSIYEKLVIDSKSFLINSIQLRKWSADYSFSKLREPNVKTDWKKHSKTAVVNAFYNLLDNSIEFPAGILQGIFFDQDRPNYLNFGAIGFVIGHEITHGFDDRGKQFDQNGNNRNWWQHETDLNFRKRAECIINQYSNYTESGLRVNGVNTQGENIADNGGLKESFRAYKKWVKDNGVEPSLPGLKYTNDQLFWISAAKIWCSKSRHELLKLKINLSQHSPSRFRVIGPMSNLVEFSDSFNCLPNDKMNPTKRCTVW